jgi:hypothetical protein
MNVEQGHTGVMQTRIHGRRGAGTVHQQPLLATCAVERDVLEIRRIRQRRAMPLIMQHLAGQTGGLLNVSDIASRVQLDNRLVGDLVSLPESVFLVHRLEAFGRTLSSRVIPAARASTWPPLA